MSAQRCFWCARHPRKSDVGVCPSCLRERLTLLAATTPLSRPPPLPPPPPPSQRHSVDCRKGSGFNISKKEDDDEEAEPARLSSSWFLSLLPSNSKTEKKISNGGGLKAGRGEEEREEAEPSRLSFSWSLSLLPRNCKKEKKKNLSLFPSDSKKEKKISIDNGNGGGLKAGRGEEREEAEPARLSLSWALSLLPSNSKKERKRKSIDSRRGGKEEEEEEEEREEAEPARLSSSWVLSLLPSNNKKEKKKSLSLFPNNSKKEKKTSIDNGDGGGLKGGRREEEKEEAEPARLSSSWAISLLSINSKKEKKKESIDCREDGGLKTGKEEEEEEEDGAATPLSLLPNDTRKEKAKKERRRSSSWGPSLCINKLMESKRTSIDGSMISCNPLYVEEKEEEEEEEEEDTTPSPSPDNSSKLANKKEPTTRQPNAKQAHPQGGWTKIKKMIRAFTPTTHTPPTKRKGALVDSRVHTMWNAYAYNSAYSFGRPRNSHILLDKSRSVRVSPANVENGLLRFYLTPLRTTASCSRRRTRTTTRTRTRSYNRQMQNGAWGI